MNLIRLFIQSYPQWRALIENKEDLERFFNMLLDNEGSEEIWH